MHGRACTRHRLAQPTHAQLCGAVHARPGPLQNAPCATHEPVTTSLPSCPDGALQVALGDPRGTNPGRQARAQLAPTARGMRQPEASAPGEDGRALQAAAPDRALQLARCRTAMWCAVACCLGEAWLPKCCTALSLDCWLLSTGCQLLGWSEGDCCSHTHFHCL